MVSEIELRAQRIADAEVHIAQALPGRIHLIGLVRWYLLEQSRNPEILEPFVDEVLSLSIPEEEKS